jgi:hypothetical protein
MDDFVKSMPRSKPENRKPKPERRPKLEIRKAVALIRASDFEFVVLVTFATAFT